MLRQSPSCSEWQRASPEEPTRGARAAWGGLCGNKHPGTAGFGHFCAESSPRGGSKETSALLAAPSRSLSAQEGPAVQLALMRAG